LATAKDDRTFFSLGSIDQTEKKYIAELLENLVAWTAKLKKE
jgi:hypothetical protein